MAQNEDAKVIAESDYGDRPVFWEEYGSHNGFFLSLADLRAWCFDHGEAVPATVHAADSRSLVFDADDLVQRELESQESDEDAYDRIDADDIARLQTMLTAWTDSVADNAQWYEWSRDTVALNEAITAAAKGKHDADRAAWAERVEAMDRNGDPF